MTKKSTTGTKKATYTVQYDGQEVVEYKHRASANRSARAQVKNQNVREARVFEGDRLVRTYVLSRGVWDSFKPDQKAS